MAAIPETVDLQWIARRIVALQDDVHSLRDDMTVAAAVLNRLDNQMSRLDSNMSLIVAELRAMRSQHDRLRTRVDALEGGRE